MVFQLSSASDVEFMMNNEIKLLLFICFLEVERTCGQSLKSISLLVCCPWIMIYSLIQLINLSYSCTLKAHPGPQCCPLLLPSKRLMTSQPNNISEVARVDQLRLARSKAQTSNLLSIKPRFRTRYPGAPILARGPFYE